MCKQWKLRLEMENSPCKESEVKKAEANVSPTAPKNYDDGLNDAWELTRKIINKDLTVANAKKCFGIDINGKSAFTITREIFSIPYKEVLAKLEAYEKEQAEIKVGDVVFCFADCDESWRENEEHYGILLEIVKSTYTVLMKNGDVAEFKKNCLEKTGKHIDISAILAEIGKE